MTWREIARRRLARLITGGPMDAPVSRQPSCPLCDHESHVFTRCHAELTRAAAYLESDDDTASVPLLCPCPPRRPTGIYD